MDKVIEGTWPENDLQRAFVAGARWWEWHKTELTMWQSDIRRAEAEAEKKYPGGHKIVDVLAAIIGKEGKFLIAKRKGGNLKGKWEFPGGKLKNNETPEECLRRELNEEFGIQVKVKGYLGENIHTYDWKRIKLVGYYVEHTSGKFRLTVHSDIRYVNPHEFRNYDLAPADIPLAKKVVENYYKNL